jgi:hypothetical protein
MTDDRQIHDDLNYVRSVLHRAEHTGGSPATIYFLWAAISFLGFAIIDFASHLTGVYWMIAGPLGGVMSGVLGYRASRAAGQSSRREGRIQAMHWGGVMAAVVLLVPLVVTHAIAIDDFPRFVLLILALFYYTAGVHTDRRMIPLSVVVVGCYLLTVFVRHVPYLWTLTGAIIAASLAAAGFLAAAHARRAA